MDENLISLLLSNKYLKDFFFVNVNKTLVFDKILFQEVITNKQLPVTLLQNIKNWS